MAVAVEFAALVDVALDCTADTADGVGCAGCAGYGSAKLHIAVAEAPFSSVRLDYLHVAHTA